MTSPRPPVDLKKKIEPDDNSEKDFQQKKQNTEQSAAQKRYDDMAHWARVNEFEKRYLNNSRPRWNRVGELPEAPDRSPVGGAIVELKNRKNLYTPGVYEDSSGKKPFNILVKEDKGGIKGVSVTPPPDDDKSFKESYAEAMDFMLLEGGVNSINIEITDGILRMERLEMLLDLAEERNIAVTLGDNLKNYMYSGLKFDSDQRAYSSNDIKYIEERIAHLERAQSQKELLYKVNNPLIGEQIKYIDESSRVNDVALKAAVNSAANAGADEVASRTKELVETIKTEQAKIEDKMERVENALSEIAVQTNARKNLLEKIATNPAAEEKPFHHSSWKVVEAYRNYKKPVNTAPLKKSEDSLHQIEETLAEENKTNSLIAENRKNLLAHLETTKASLLEDHKACQVAIKALEDKPENGEKLSDKLSVEDKKLLRDLKKANEGLEKKISTIDKSVEEAKKSDKEIVSEIKNVKALVADTKKDSEAQLKKKT